MATCGKLSDLSVVMHDILMTLNDDIKSFSLLIVIPETLKCFKDWSFGCELHLRIGIIVDKKSANIGRYQQ